MQATQHFTPPRQAICAGLLERPLWPGLAGDPNRPLLASLLTGRLCGEGCLSATLGLGRKEYGRLLATYFPGPAGPLGRLKDGTAEDIPELEDIVTLLLDHRAQRRQSEVWVARIIAAGCAGRDHLWQDLGLANRNELSQLLWINFPGLARANTGDMKWKKFIYKLMCERDGTYVCPAPSCRECADHPLCFSPET